MQLPPSPVSLSMIDQLASQPSLRPLGKGCLNSVSHKVFLRCLPVYGGTTSATITGAIRYHTRCFARNISFPKEAKNNNKKWNKFIKEHHQNIIIGSSTVCPVNPDSFNFNKKSPSCTRTPHTLSRLCHPSFSPLVSPPPRPRDRVDLNLVHPAPSGRGDGRLGTQDSGTQYSGTRRCVPHLIKDIHVIT